LSLCKYMPENPAHPFLALACSEKGLLPLSRLLKRNAYNIKRIVVYIFGVKHAQLGPMVILPLISLLDDKCIKIRESAKRVLDRLTKNRIPLHSTEESIRWFLQNALYMYLSSEGEKVVFCVDESRKQKRIPIRWKTCAPLAEAEKVAIKVKIKSIAKACQLSHLLPPDW